MKFQTLVILSLALLNQAIPDRRAGGFAIDPLPTAPTGPTTPTTGPTTPTSTSESSSTTSGSTSGSSTDTSTTATSTNGLPPISISPSSSQPSSTSSSSQLQTTSQQTSTDVVTVTSNGSTIPTTQSQTTNSPSANPSGNGGDNPPVSTGTIVGLSVAGGIAVFGAVAFVIWKLTRKRFSEFDADGEEIKWPELGQESHALPTRPTGRVGVDDDGYDEAGVDGAGRRFGNYAPSATTGETSMADLHSYNDPYAVPPLPHLDPNQPYHDDPANYGGHYDPYQGPIPQSFHDPANIDRIGSHSPAPGNYGRQSPGPSLSYSRTGY